MPIPKNTIRVLPNPWIFIHHELGPQGHCHVDTGGRGSDLRYVGAEDDPNRIKLLHDYESNPSETRLNVHVQAWRFPALDASLAKPAVGFESGIELPKTHYYLDRLRDGDLVPADKRTLNDQPCKFASLAEARDAGIAAFEANYGDGSFAEAFPEPSVAKPAPAPDQAPPPAFTTAPSTESTAAETPNAKRSRLSPGADK